MYRWFRLLYTTTRSRSSQRLDCRLILQFLNLFLGEIRGQVSFSVLSTCTNAGVRYILQVQLYNPLEEFSSEFALPLLANASKEGLSFSFQHISVKGPYCSPFKYDVALNLYAKQLLRFSVIRNFFDFMHWINTVLVSDQSCNSGFANILVWLFKFSYP